MLTRIAMRTLFASLLWLLLIANGKTAVAPPPWANPSINPCAAQPRGWQLLYWPADGKCYKIFQIGAPCPESMELGPAAGGSGTVAECRCPPGTAQSPRDALCHPIYSRASCDPGQYFAPVPEAPGKSSSKRRWGVCRKPEPCPEKGEVYWPKDEKCYPKFTRGPCPRGELLVTETDGLATCSCSTKGELGLYHWPGPEGGCHEHYTRGPCTEPGELFLPGGRCGCHSGLPHYHTQTKMCYPLGSHGPCPFGHNFVADPEDVERTDVVRAKCSCKPGRVAYRKNGFCYRLHTRGPCDVGQMLVNSTTCLSVPCKRGRLYFPNEKTCYKIGSRGPCPNGEIVLYDQTVRPSIDGIAYNGICGCTTDMKNSGICRDDEPQDCEPPGMIAVDGTCYGLYSQGPCATGEWLVAARNSRNEIWRSGNGENRRRARCECRPGYKRPVDDSTDSENNVFNSTGGCQPPAVRLAKFLNDQIKSINF